MDITRREFLKKTGRLALLLTIPGCSGGEPKPTPSPSNTYIPQVNSPPFSEAEYFLEKSKSDDMGIVWVHTYYDRKAYNVRLIDERNREISGLETIFYKDDVSGEGMFYIIDPDRKYIPNMSIPSSFNIVSQESLSEDSLSQNNTWPWNFVTMYLKKDYDEWHNIVVQEIEESLPSWDSDNICAVPGFIYLGDWSFNQLKKLNTNLNHASTIISVVAPNPVTSGVAGVLAGTGKVLDGIDFVIDQLNSLFPSWDIDKDEEYSLYQPPRGLAGMVLSLASYNYCKRDEEDIKYLLPTQIGNLWTFKSGFDRATIEIKGTKRINGKELLVTKNTGGINEYFGFNKDTFCQYGFNESVIGDVFFNPPLKIGDNRVGIGKTYSTSSEIISEKHPDISGSVDELFSYVDRETVIVSNTPYGDCFKVKEDFDLQMSGNKGSASTSETAYHWYAKNVGKVKQYYQGRTVELVNAIINNKGPSLKSSASSLESSHQLSSLESSLKPFSISQKVVEDIRRVI